MEKNFQIHKDKLLIRIEYLAKQSNIRKNKDVFRHFEFLRMYLPLTLFQKDTIKDFQFKQERWRHMIPEMGLQQRKRQWNSLNDDNGKS